MGLEGRLEGTGLLDFFQLIDRSKTGALRVFAESRTFTVFIRDGAAAAALVSPPRAGERLLERLVRAGRLSEQRLADALMLQQRDGRALIGQMIVEQGWVPAGDVLAALECQLRETVFSLFLIEAGRLRFDECPVELPALTPRPSGLISLLLEGINLRNDWPRILEAEPSVSAHLSLRPGLSPERLDAMSDEERSVSAQIGDGIEYARLLERSLVDTYTLRRSVVRLLQEGDLRVAVEQGTSSGTWQKLAEQMDRFPASPSNVIRAVNGSDPTGGHKPPAARPTEGGPGPSKAGVGPSTQTSSKTSSERGINLGRWRSSRGPLPSKALIELSYRVSKAVLDLRQKRALPVALSAASFEQRNRGLEIIETGPPLDIAPDGRRDVYALGAVLYELACGQPPRPGPGGAAPFHVVAPDADVPTTLEMIIQRCLLPEPERRYPDPRGVVAALDVLRRAKDVW